MNSSNEGILIDVPTTPVVKRCRRCGELRGLDAFAKDATRVFGHLNVCRGCHALSVRASRARHVNPGIKLQKDRAWRESEKGRAIVKKHERRRVEARWSDLVLAASNLYYLAKRRAREAGVPFNITKADVVIPARCPVLDVPLSVCKGKVGPCSPSLDRIIPAAGYVRGNVQVISFKANTIKNNATIDELEKVLDYVRSKSV